MTRFPPIDVRHPQPFDILDERFTVVGMLNTGDTGIEVHVLDADGNDLVPAVSSGSPMNGGGEFRANVELTSAPTATGTVRVAPFGGDPVDIEVSFGTGLMASYGGYGVHVVAPCAPCAAPATCSANASRSTDGLGQNKKASRSM